MKYWTYLGKLLTVIFVTFSFIPPTYAVDFSSYVPGFSNPNQEDSNDFSHTPMITQNHSSVERFPNSAWLDHIPMERNRMTLVEGRSHFMRFITKVTRISISNPEILDFITLAPNEILINTKRHGSVNLIAWNDDGQVSSFEINVTRDPGVLGELLGEIDPEGEFRIFPCMIETFGSHLSNPLPSTPHRFHGHNREQCCFQGNCRKPG